MRPETYRAANIPLTGTVGTGCPAVRGEASAGNGPVSACVGIVVFVLAELLAWVIGPAEAPEIDLAEVDLPKALSG
jgi:hypothetical protein